ncbi:hypothetical protein [Bradyrhizobium sp. 153]|uniref:hypothetical protein n=1 Tax=Bradyrhizobium sp. 153 TaxID=2782627 RepID=UPI001FF979D5|nr:hypothetical protein [Bradyrhizobium sp. 153]MCK1669398.1 hypothetical protein [Bradyrhizobium sp. 153]
MRRSDLAPTQTAPGSEITHQRRAVRDVASFPRRPLLLSEKQRDFLRRRTRPFLEGMGPDRPLSLLLEEAYLQGMRDAAQAMQSPENSPERGAEPA